MALAPVQAHEDPSMAPDVQRAIDTNEFDGWSAEKILIWSIGKFHPRLSLSASFGAPEGMVLLHMMHEIDPSSRVRALCRAEGFDPGQLQMGADRRRFRHGDRDHPVCVGQQAGDQDGPQGGVGRYLHPFRQ